MQMVVVRVVVKVHQHRLTLIVVAHLVQILPCYTNQLFLGILRTLTGNGSMKLSLPCTVIPGRIVHEIVTKRRDTSHIGSILQIPEVTDGHQLSHTILHLPLVVADCREGTA